MLRLFSWIVAILLLVFLIVTLVFASIGLWCNVGGQAELFRDLLTIVLAIAGIGIAAGGFLVYKLILGQVQKEAREEGQKSLARALASEGFFRWRDYERAGKALSDFHYVEWAIEVTQNAHGSVRGLDEKNEDVERLLCDIRNNLAYYLAERQRQGRGQTGDKEIAKQYADHIRQKMPKYPSERAEWADTCNFVNSQFP